MLPEVCISRAEGRKPGGTFVKDTRERLTENALTASLALYAIVCPVSQSAVYVSLSLAVAAALLLRKRAPEKSVFPEQFGLLLGVFSLFVAWQCLSMVVNGASSFAPPLLRAWNFVPLFVLARLPVPQERKKATAKIALFALFLSTSIVILVAILQEITGLVLPFKHQLFSGGVIVGFFSHHLPAGGFFSTVAVLSASLFLFWETSRWVKTVLALLTLLLLLGTVLTLSRTYFVSLAVTLPLMLLRKKFGTAMWGIAAIALLVLLAVVSLPEVKSRTASILDLKKDPSNVERLYLWRVAEDMIRAHPVAGVGFKQWGEHVSEYTARYASEWTFSEASFHHAHDVYLTVAAETGLVGLFLFLAFWLYLFSLTVRTASAFRSDSFVRALNLGASYVLINLLTGGLFEENFGTLPIMHLLAFILTLSFFVTAREPGAAVD